MSHRDINFVLKKMEPNQQSTQTPQLFSLENLPQTIFGVSTKDVLTAIAGLSMAVVAINRIINSKKS